MFSEKPSKLTPFHVADGMGIYMARSDENPDDDFLANRYAKPQSVAQEPDGGE